MFRDSIRFCIIYVILKIEFPFLTHTKKEKRTEQPSIMDHVQYAFLANAVDSSGTRLREYKILFYESCSKKPSLLEVVRCFNFKFSFSLRETFIPNDSNQTALQRQQQTIHQQSTDEIKIERYLCWWCCDNKFASVLHSRIRGQSHELRPQLDQATYSLHGQTGGNETIRRCGVIGREEWIDCC